MWNTTHAIYSLRDVSPDVIKCKYAIHIIHFYFSYGKEKGFIEMTHLDLIYPTLLMILLETVRRAHLKLLRFKRYIHWRALWQQFELAMQDKSSANFWKNVIIGSDCFSNNVDVNNPDHKWLDKPILLHFIVVFKNQVQKQLTPMIITKGQSSPNGTLFCSRN